MKKNSQNNSTPIYTYTIIMHIEVKSSSSSIASIMVYLPTCAINPSHACNTCPMDPLGDDSAKSLADGDSQTHFFSRRFAGLMDQLKMINPSSMINSASCLAMENRAPLFWELLDNVNSSSVRVLSRNFCNFQVSELQQPCRTN